MANDRATISESKETHGGTTTLHAMTEEHPPYIPPSLTPDVSHDSMSPPSPLLVGSSVPFGSSSNSSNSTAPDGTCDINANTHSGVRMTIPNTDNDSR